MRRHADEMIIELASNQQGLVTRTQLLDGGLSRHAVGRRLKTGFLHALHTGVYQLGPVTAPRARELAGVLACGGGVISHRSAAAVWQDLPPQQSSDPVDVTHPFLSQRGAARPGIRVHRSPLRTDEIRRVDGLDVTSRLRTLLDLSTCVDARDLERALARAERAEADLRERLQHALAQRSGRNRARQLRALLSGSDPLAFTRSEAEERLLTLIRQGGLPQPETNVIVHGYEVDFYWRRERLAVEVDGYAFHRSRHAFVQDRQRDSALTAAGIRVLRLSWRQVNDEREKLIVQLALALARTTA